MNTNETTKPADPQEREREWLRNLRDVPSGLHGIQSIDALYSVLAAYRAHVLDEAIDKAEKMIRDDVRCDWDNGFQTAIRAMITELSVLRNMKEKP